MPWRQDLATIHRTHCLLPSPSQILIVFLVRYCSMQPQMQRRFLPRRETARRLDHDPWCRVLTRSLSQILPESLQLLHLRHPLLVSMSWIATNVALMMWWESYWHETHLLLGSTTRSIGGSPLSIRVEDGVRYETSSTLRLQLHLMNSLDETNVLSGET